MLSNDVRPATNKHVAQLQAQPSMVLPARSFFGSNPTIRLPKTIKPELEAAFHKAVAKGLVKDQKEFMLLLVVKGLKAL